MSLLNLPDELLSRILGDDKGFQSTLDKTDYLNLSRVNKQLNTIVYPALYRRLEIKLGAYHEDKPSKTDEVVRNKLLKEPGLGSYVRELIIGCDHRQFKDANVICLDILRVTSNLETLRFTGYYGLESKKFVKQLTGLLRSGLFTKLTTLCVPNSLCTCKMARYLSIRGLHCLSLGYYDNYIEKRCNHRHDLLEAPDVTSESTVSQLSISSWEPTPSLSTILSLPKNLLVFEGEWNPWGTPYSPLSVSKFLFPHKTSLKILNLSAAIDWNDEDEPQRSDGTFANFAEYTALENLTCGYEIFLPQYFTDSNFFGPDAESFAERLPPQLQSLTVQGLPPQLLSRHAHKPDSAKSMATFDKNLTFVRSLSRAAHQTLHLSSLRSVTLKEASDIHGPLEGPYLRTIVKHMEWREDEKSAWCERGPFPFAAVNMSLSAQLVFVVRGWEREPRGSDATKEMEERVDKRVRELDEGLNLDDDEVW